MFARMGMRPTGQRLRENENGASAHALVFVVDFFNAAWFHHYRFTAIGQQLIRFFVHANNGAVWVIRQTV